MADILTPRPAPVQVPRADDDELTHSFCCDPDLGICGADLTGVPLSVDPDDLACVVCEDPEVPCSVCGRDGYL